jgi:hypothetical protein
MPAVKAGSIIEYHYVSTMKHYGYLDKWEFQSDLPTVKSNYFLSDTSWKRVCIYYSEKTYSQHCCKADGDQGKIYFEIE